MKGLWRKDGCEFKPQCWFDEENVFNGTFSLLSFLTLLLTHILHWLHHPTGVICYVQSK